MDFVLHFLVKWLKNVQYSQADINKHRLVVKVGQKWHQFQRTSYVHVRSSIPWQKQPAGTPRLGRDRHGP